MTKSRPETGPSLTIARLIPASHERVFDAWLDPARLARFMLPREGGRAEVTVDPRVGKLAVAAIE